MADLTAEQTSQLTDLANEAAEAVKQLGEVAEKTQEVTDALDAATKLQQEIADYTKSGEFNPDALGDFAERLVTVVSDHLPISDALKKLVGAIAALWGKLVSGMAGVGAGLVNAPIEGSIGRTSSAATDIQNYNTMIDQHTDYPAGLKKWLKGHYRLKRNGLLTDEDSNAIWLVLKLVFWDGRKERPADKEKLKKTIKRTLEGVKKHLHGPHGRLLTDAVGLREVEISLHGAGPGVTSTAVLRLCI